MNLNGYWKVQYVGVPTPAVPDAEDSYSAIVVLCDGIIIGVDHGGGTQTGSYELEGETLTVQLNIDFDIDAYYSAIPDAQPPYRLKLVGQYSSPDFLSVKGGIDGPERADVEMVVNCKRLGDLSTMRIQLIGE